MKRAAALVLIFCILLSLPSVGYAFFYYGVGKDAETGADTSTSNALFDAADKNEYYRVYFFASPYYATGAEIDGEPVDDPLTIANSENNPYNSDEDYMLIGSSLKSTPKYANVTFADGGKHYISYKKRNEEIAPGQWGAFEPFSKKDYTGYIRANEEAGLSKNTSTYVSMTVQGNLSIAQLASMVAATEFKDSYGFGPEFIGWSYDKETMKKRTMVEVGTGISRYPQGNMTLGDSRGYNKGGIAYQIGDFGSQVAIEQITSLTSLKEIDSGTQDGSQAGDRVIYLYPIFLAKNYTKQNAIGGEITSILKFRVNADERMDGDNFFYYEFDQSAEINYAENRYTVGLLQHPLDKTRTNVNYYVNNVYIDKKNRMQLDICPISSNGWATSWSTLLTAEQIAALVPEAGYYNISVTLVKVSGTETPSEKTLAELRAVYEGRRDFISVMTSQDVADGGVVSFPIDRNNANGGRMRAYYAIGVQRVEEFHLVGEGLNGAIDDYTTEGFEILHTSTQLGSEVDYILDGVYLYAGSRLSVLTADTDGRYTLSAMPSLVLESVNASLSPTEKPFTAVGSAGSTLPLFVAEDGTLRVARSDSYTLIFRITYEDGLPREISIAYRENEARYSFVVLTEAPTADRFYTANDALTALTLARCDALMGTSVDLTTSLYSFTATGGATRTQTVEALLGAHAGEVLVDTATGLSLSYELFASGEFALNRNYILYFKAA